MNKFAESRRNFIKTAGLAAGAVALSPKGGVSLSRSAGTAAQSAAAGDEAGPADYTLRIKTCPIEVAPDRIISATTYNAQFPGPLLRFKEGRPVTVDVYNDTRRPEQLHWHGQLVPSDVDGASEEGTPFIPAHGKRRIVFTPKPAGFRFYHTHVRAGANLSAGMYGGEVGPVYIEPHDDPGRYDKEEFLVLKEFQPTFSHGGDMAMDFMSPAARVKSLQQLGESEMDASLAKGMLKGYEVGYDSFTINGRMLGHGEPIRVKQGERLLFHVLNGSATEIRSLWLPGHSFQVVALDGNAVPNPASVPVLWLGTAERVSAIVEMNNPGVWVLGDLDDDDRGHGMGIVVEYAGRTGKPQWTAPPPFRWSYARFAKPGATAPPVDQTFTMLIEKDNSADEGFNRWTINGVAYPSGKMAPPAFHLRQGARYRIHLRNASDDVHPIHLHRHIFELTNLDGLSTAGVMKDVVMLSGYQETEIDFTANDPGLTLFHCHQQLHMDFGLMTVFDYV